MKLYPVCIGILFAFSVSSCKKNDELPLADLSNPTPYVLRHQNYEHVSGTNGEDVYFIYDLSLSRVGNMTIIHWGYSDVNNPPVHKQYDTTNYNFKYQDDRLVGYEMWNNSGQWQIEYEYQGPRITTKITKVYNGPIQKYNLYKYNSAGQISEAVDSTPGRANFRQVFEYDKNLTTITNYNLWSNPQKKSKTVYSNFDNKVNFIRTVNGLPVLTGVENLNLHPLSSFSLNNYGQENFYSEVDINGSFGAPHVTTYNYEYNTEGLPVKMMYAGWTVTMEYEKRK